MDTAKAEKNKIPKGLFNAFAPLELTQKKAK